MKFAAKLGNPWRHFVEHYILTVLLSVLGPFVVMTELVLYSWGVLDGENLGILLGPAPLLAFVVAKWVIGSVFGFPEADHASSALDSVLASVGLFLALPLVMTIMCSLPILVIMQLYRWSRHAIQRARRRPKGTSFRSQDMSFLKFSSVVPIYLVCAVPVTVASALGAYLCLYCWGLAPAASERYQEAVFGGASGLFYSLGPLVIMFLRRDCSQHVKYE